MEQQSDPAQVIELAARHRATRWPTINPELTVQDWVRLVELDHRTASREELEWAIETWGQVCRWAEAIRATTAAELRRRQHSARQWHPSMVRAR